jgi:hypothetical protein
MPSGHTTACPMTGLAVCRRLTVSRAAHVPYGAAVIVTMMTSGPQVPERYACIGEVVMRYYDGMRTVCDPAVGSE